MANIKKRIERLENYAPTTMPEKYIALLLKLRGFKEMYGLGDDASAEEVEAAIHRGRRRANRGTDRATSESPKGKGTV